MPPFCLAHHYLHYCSHEHSNKWLYHTPAITTKSIAYLYMRHTWKVKSTWKVPEKWKAHEMHTWKVKSTWLKSEKHMKSTPHRWKAHEKYLKSEKHMKCTWKTCAPHAFPLTRSKWDIYVQFSCFCSQNFIWKVLRFSWKAALFVKSVALFERPLARNRNPMFDYFLISPVAGEVTWWKQRRWRILSLRSMGSDFHR